MSKTTRALAIMGVVAGLGVAALPLGAYATTTDSATMKVRATVSDTISITVQGNKAAYQEDDTTNNPAQYHAGDENTGGALEYGKFGLISLDSLTPGSVMEEAVTTPTPAAAKNYEEGSMKIVSNNLIGYNVVAAASELVGADDTTDNITVGDPTTIDAANNKSHWSYRIKKPTSFGTAGYTYKLGIGETAAGWDGSFGTDYSAWETRTAGGNVILREETDATTANASTGGDVYTLGFGVSIKPTQHADVYTGSLVLTASNNVAAAHYL